MLQLLSEKKKTFVVFPSQLRKCNKEKKCFVPCSKMPIMFDYIRQLSENKAKIEITIFNDCLINV